MPHARSAAALEYMQKAGQVGFGINMRMIDRVPHPGLCGQVNHSFERALRKQRFHGGSVCDIQLREIEIAKCAQTLQPRSLEARIVVGVEIVDSHNLLTLTEQSFSDVIADESRG